MATINEQQAEQLKTEEKPVYQKICKNPKCNCEYLSDSRNQKYCSDECAEYMKGVVKKKTKRKAVRRKEYDKNREINRALSKAYSLCETVFELYKIPKVCNCKEHGLEGECSGPLQRHHKNGNPFDNSPWNLEYECARHHKMYHDKVGDINMVDTYNEAIDEAGFDNDDEKYITMVRYTRKKIEDAGVLDIIE